MSSTNKTTHYELPQFVENDIFNPLVDDNDAYAKIDTALYNIANAEADDAAEIIAAKGRLDIVEGKVGNLETQNGTDALTTTAQTLSGAVNELKSGEDSLDGRLDIVEDDINNVSTGLKAKVTALENQNGSAVLETTAQTLSGAVNEVFDRIKNDELLSKVIFMPVNNSIPDTTTCGECTVFVTKAKHAIMIDSGHSSAYDIIKSKLVEYDISHIDYFILSHYHPDHYGNIASLISDGYIDNETISYLPRTTSSSTPDWGNEAWVREQLAITTVRTPSSTEPLEVDDMTFDFFNCDAEDVAYYDSLNLTDANPYSVMCYVTYMGTTILMTGDSTETSDNYVVAQGYIHKCDIFKIGHHALGSVGQGIYNVSMPEYAVFSQTNGRLDEVSTTYNKVAYCDLFNVKTKGTGFGEVVVGMSDHIYSVLSKSPLIHSNSSYIAKFYVGTNNTGAEYGTEANPYTDINLALAMIASLGSCRRVDLFLKGNYTFDERLPIKDIRNKLRIVGDRESDVNLATIKQIFVAYCNNITLENINVSFAENGIALEFQQCPLAYITGCNITGNQLAGTDGRGISIAGTVLYAYNNVISNKKRVFYFNFGGELFANTISGSNNEQLVVGYGNARFISSTIAYAELSNGNDSLTNIDFNVEKQHRHVGEYVLYSKYLAAGATQTVTIPLSGNNFNHALFEILTSKGDVYRLTRFNSSCSTVAHVVVGDLDTTQTCNISTSGLDLIIEHDKGVTVKAIPITN